MTAGDCILTRLLSRGGGAIIAPPPGCPTRNTPWPTAGDAHVIRNAGGIITPDELRSLAIGPRLLGTTEIMLIHHTDCGMLTFTDEEFRSAIEDETGVRPAWESEAFDDLDTDLRQSIARILADPSIPVTTSVRGFVYSVEDRSMREVT